MTFLQHVGSIFKKALHIGEEAAIIAEPFVAVQFPEIVPIYTSAIGLAFGAEGTAAQATGTGPQKLAQVLTQLVPQAQKWATANGIDWPAQDVQKWASAVVDTINLVPSPVAKTSTPAPTPEPPITPMA